MLMYSDGLTVRLSNLPPETRPTDVSRFFDSRIGPTGTVIAANGIGNIVTQARRSTKQTTVTFKTRDLKKRALKDCDDQLFSSEFGDGSVPIKIEDSFDGLTTLHYPATAEPNLEYDHPLYAKFLEIINHKIALSPFTA